MSKDFYKTLGIDKSANDDEIRKAYKKLALKYHPDKNKDTNATEKFKEIAEAYEVLSDKNKRSIFDERGSYQNPFQKPKGYQSKGNPGFQYFDKYKDWQTPQNWSRRSYSSHNNGSGRTYIFSNGTGSGPNLDGVDEDGYTRFSSGQESRNNHGWHHSHSTNPIPKQQDAAVEHEILLTLEEVLNGTSKKMKINRKALHPDGRSYREEKVLNIDVKPGWKAGTKVTFPREGDQSANAIAADIVFIIKDKPHPIFKRDGSDIHYVHKMSLKEVLTNNSPLRIPTLTGQCISLPISGVIKPTTKKVIPKQGLPHTKDPTKFGDLIVTFDIQFPDKIGDEARKLILQALP